jgi:hypothetical protein
MKKYMIVAVLALLTVSQIQAILAGKLATVRADVQARLLAL